MQFFCTIPSIFTKLFNSLLLVGQYENKSYKLKNFGITDMQIDNNF